MDADQENGPSEINSYRLSKAFDENVIDLDKKRKLQDEQLFLPISKHKCWDHRIFCRPLSTLEENQADSLITLIIEENAELQTLEDTSDPESAKDSNSLLSDHDCSMSTREERKPETENSEQWHSDRPSTSSDCSCTDLKGTECSLESTTASTSAGKDGMVFVAQELYPYHKYNELRRNLNNSILHFGSQSDYLSSDHGIESNEPLQPCTDKEFDDIFYSNVANPNTFVLSSGRWTVKQDGQTNTRKPTIDQEFEQYFSTLML